MIQGCGRRIVNACKYGLINLWTLENKSGNQYYYVLIMDTTPYFKDKPEHGVVRSF